MEAVDALKSVLCGPDGKWCTSMATNRTAQQKHLKKGTRRLMRFNA